jgi:hypothetical protein
VLLAVAIVAALGLIVIAGFAPREAAAGWLIAFVAVSAIPVGSLALLLIHRLTGGRWGDALQPLLAAAAACIPLLALLFVPALIALPMLYPWAAGAVADMKPDVGAWYLNSGSFIARTLVAFIGWSALALWLPRAQGRSATLLAAIGLVFYAVSISLIPIDWILSAQPVFISTSFGASIAFMQLLAALAFAAVAAPGLDEPATRDLGGLMLAVILGLIYIDFMAVLVIWYGDLPRKVDWFVARTFAPWKWLAIGAFLLSAVAPLLALLLARVRGSRPALRVIGASVLTGLAFYAAYLLAPPYGPWALATGALSLVALFCAVLACVESGWPAALFGRWGTAHG